MAVQGKVTQKEKDLDAFENEEKVQNDIKLKAEYLYNILLPFESKIMTAQCLIVWETPVYSSLFFLGIHLTFWLATRIPIYYLCGLVGFFLNAFKLWVYQIWPEIKVPISPSQDPEDWTPVHPRLLGVPEISWQLARTQLRLEQLIGSARRLHSQHPAKFFVLAMFTFGCLGTLGHYVSGILLLYISVMSCLLLPCLSYYDVINRMQDKVCPLVAQVEESMNIKRKRASKRSKKTEAEPSPQGEEFLDSDDEELLDFVPQVPASQLSSKLSLKVQYSDSDDESTRLTPRLPTHNMPDAEYSDDDSTMDDMPSQMPSVLQLDDSVDFEFRQSLLDTDMNASNNSSTCDTQPHRDVMNQDGGDSTSADVTLHEDESMETESATTRARGCSLPLTDDSITDSLLDDESAITPTAEAPAMFTPESDDNSSATSASSGTTSGGSRSLRFVPEHFRQSSDDDDSRPDAPSFPTQDRLLSDDVTQLSRGDRTGLTAGGTGLMEQTGVILSSALTSVQQTVSKMAASQMVTSLMQTTGLMQKGQGQGKGQVEGQEVVSQDVETEFEFLNEEDFKNLDTDEN